MSKQVTCHAMIGLTLVRRRPAASKQAGRQADAARPQAEEQARRGGQEEEKGKGITYV